MAEPVYWFRNMWAPLVTPWLHCEVAPDSDIAQRLATAPAGHIVDTGYGHEYKWEPSDARP